MPDPTPPAGRLAWLRTMSDRERVGLILFILIVGSLLIRFVVEWREGLNTLTLVALTFVATRLFYLARTERLRPTITAPPPGRRRR